mgnify:CR=1 FL=1
MKPTGTLLQRATLTLASLALIGLLGCGDDSGLGTRYKVSGKVTFKGQPVQKGSITFVPDDPNGREATGEIVNGNYTLTTVRDSDGALPGKYKVAISSKDVNLEEAQKNAAAGGGGALRQDDVAKAAAAAKDLVPAKYSLTDTSGLTYEVKSGGNTANFDLAE